MIKIFLILLLAHLIADFVTQTTYINKNKRQFLHPLYSKGLLYHCIHHLLVSVALLLIFVEWQPMLIPILIVIVLLHYFIDFTKIRFEERVMADLIAKDEHEKYWIAYLFEKKSSYFILDQFLHIVSIYLVLAVFRLNPSYHIIYQTLIIDGQAMEGELKTIVLGVLIVLVTFAAAYFIASLMSDLQEDKVENEIAASTESDDEHIKMMRSKIHSAKSDLTINEGYRAKNEDYILQVQYQEYNNANENSRGKYIGILERILIIIFIVANQFTGLALLVAMKTIARFKQFEDKSFAEYYLIGTLLSLIIGMGFSFIIDWYL